MAPIGTLAAKMFGAAQRLPRGIVAAAMSVHVVCILALLADLGFELRDLSVGSN